MSSLLSGNLLINILHDCLTLGNIRVFVGPVPENNDRPLKDVLPIRKVVDDAPLLHGRENDQRRTQDLPRDHPAAVVAVARVLRPDDVEVAGDGPLHVRRHANVLVVPAEGVVDRVVHKGPVQPGLELEGTDLEVEYEFVVGVSEDPIRGSGLGRAIVRTYSPRLLCQGHFLPPFECMHHRTPR